MGDKVGELLVALLLGMEDGRSHGTLALNCRWLAKGRAGSEFSSSGAGFVLSHPNTTFSSFLVPFMAIGHNCQISVRV